MKHIVSLSMTSSSSNFESVVDFLGQKIRISHYGCDFDVSTLKALIKKHDGHADVIALTGVAPTIKIKKLILTHRQSTKIYSWAQHSLIADGFTLRNTYIPWVIRDYVKKHPTVFHKQRIGFHCGLIQRPLVTVLSEFTDRLEFADPYFFSGIPKIIEGEAELDNFAKRYKRLIERVSLNVHKRGFYVHKGIAARLLKKFTGCPIIVSSSTLIERFTFEHLKDKIIMIDNLDHRLKKNLQEAGVREVLHFMPKLDVLEQEERINFPILEALFMCHKKILEPISSDDILKWISELHLRPQIHSLNKREFVKPNKFAFIVHPLSVSHLFRHPAFKPIEPLAKKLERPIEKAASHLPAVKYGTIKGIKSEHSQQETEGIIYNLFATPSMMKEADPEVIYRDLVRTAHLASDEGADIIGLGAYTKIVGDAGVTVAKRSPIPVTTGNSLSASATLWAARDASEKLGFLPRFKIGKSIDGMAMIIGATGSIGAVSAQLLSGVFSDIVLVAPRPDKVLELKEEIESKSKTTARIHVATNPDSYTSHCDIIVTSTSSIREKVLDISKVKPGCIICDVSRPLAISEAEALSRPDVLVIESGEVELPGVVELSCDIGLQDSVVYACLAETALLALEGRMESFTLSRSINFEKVREIYDMAKKHGARLAKIRGHAGEITDQEIKLCREHALKALATEHWKKILSQKPV